MGALFGQRAYIVADPAEVESELRFPAAALARAESPMSLLPCREVFTDPYDHMSDSVK